MFRSIRSIGLATVVCVITLAAGACSSADTEAIHGLWFLEAIDDESATLTIDPAHSTRTHADTAHWMSIAPDGSLIGEGPCNDIEGSYTFDGESAEAIDVAMSAVSCGDSDAFEMALVELMWASHPATIAFDDEGRTMTWSVGSSTLQYARQQR